MNSQNEGATPEPATGSDNYYGVTGRKHCWQWVWIGTQWTDRVRCTTCDIEKVAERFEGQRGVS